MTKDEIFEKLQTEVTIRGLSTGTYYTYKRAIDLFLNWTNKPYEELEEIDFRNYLLFLINRGDLTTADGWDHVLASYSIMMILLFYHPWRAKSALRIVLRTALWVVGQADVYHPLS